MKYIIIVAEEWPYTPCLRQCKYGRSTDVVAPASSSSGKW